MSTLQIIGPGLHPDDLWRNIFWLRERIETLEKKVGELETLIETLENEVDLLFGDTE